MKQNIYILAIETTTTICSVALSLNNELLAKKSIDNGYSHAENLTPFIETLLNEANISAGQLSAIAVSRGPGSYTGLRIGVSAAKGLCYALGIPLIAVDTLKAMTYGVIQQAYDFFVPMIDARRMEVYAAVYDKNATVIQPVNPEILTEQSFQPLLSKGKTLFFGNGAEKSQQVITHSNAFFDIHNGLPDAQHIAHLAFEKYQNRQFEDVAYFEPFYLKAFQATTPKKLI
jgi:tRNA threonylcarbamoyladenosine biosynthesis protein TsaB